MKKPVLVLGGGIAGIQASLDLAEMNIPVFLVEKSPSIGGRMAQLDKTFPTNDCSACILAPKVTSCYNHPLVKTFTWSELLEIKGEAPNFTAVIKKKARFIDEDLCIGCSACTRRCPVTVKNEFDMGLGDRRAVFKPYAQAVPNIVAIEKKGTSPCKYGCPAHMDANGYVALAGQGRFDDALELIRRTTPFAGVLGRVCSAPCESRCYRQHVDSPVALASIKRFLADNEVKEGKSPKVKFKAKPREEKVAVVGSGPTGLNCAYQLAILGYKVTVFEALSVPGGMLRVGIPNFRLDKEVVDREIQIIKDMGVEIRLNTPIGSELTLDDLREQGYKAFFLAVGANRAKKLGIAGEDDVSGVITAIDFLRDLNLGKHKGIGQKVVVVGGEYGAVDSARAALRLGSDVTLIYEGNESDIAAKPEEIQQAIEEGVKFEFFTDALSIQGENGAIQVKCIRKSDGSELIVEGDTLITAAGFTAPDTLISNIHNPDVFVQSYPASSSKTVIEAIAEGNRVAKSIHNFLQGTNIPVEPFLLEETPIEKADFKAGKPLDPVTAPVLNREERIRGFYEVNLGIQTAEEAREEALRCMNCSVCAECRACEKVCPPKAIRHEQQDEILEIEVSSVILAAGYDPVDNIPGEFGYGTSPNIVTSLEYERILSASGPYKGQVKRPSDGRIPSKIAFIQCVGSRDEKCDAGYCSAVCCMYAVKEAIITKEHLPNVEIVDIFYMDMRAYGKDFDKYVDSAKDKYGIGFIKSRIADISEDKASENLVIKYCDEAGNMSTGEYDMVVLSVGLKPNKELQELLENSGIKTDHHGFSWTNEIEPPKTSRPGIFACGAAAGPKDIPETVVEASAAASEASKLAGKTYVDSSHYSRYFKEQEENFIRDVSREPVRIGVFVCHCGSNIGGFLDVKEVARYAKTLPLVEYSRDYLYACSVDTQKTIAETIKRNKLNRIVIASCTPRTHEPLFQEVLARAGLNPYLVTMANIRDQCSWVHMEKYEEATEKAKDLVRMAVARITFAKPLTRQQIDVTKEALVVGGGMAGITAALEMAGMGYKTYLVERSDRLGGNAAKLALSPTGRYYSPYIHKYIHDVMNNPLIEVLLDTEIEEINGYVGNFTTKLKVRDQMRTIKHGVVIVATGAREAKPREYLYGKHNSIITQMDLEGRILAGELDVNNIKNVVMIQCVGSRDKERPYCSRVCCNQAIKNAMILKQMNEDINVTIVYRDIRSYGLNETNYRRARQAGVQFIHYEPERKPELVLRDEKVYIKVYDPIIDSTIAIESDLLVLSAGMECQTDDNKRLGQLLKVPLNQEGFFLEAHAKLNPVDFATEGVFLCGLAHGPKNMKESISQAKAAAARGATIISKDRLETEGTVARVSENDCTACGACERVCPYKAIAVEEYQIRDGIVRHAVVNPVLCKGCGTCSAACRCGAIDVNGFADRQVLSEIDMLISSL